VVPDSQLLLTGASSRVVLVRRWLTSTFPGRALLTGTFIKVAAFVLGLAAAGSFLVGVIDTIGDITLMAGAVVLGYRLFVDARRRLLWRVRRKLTISYIFIGFVPALLIITFFLLGGLLLFFNVGAYAMKTRLDALVEQAHFLADAAAIEIAQTNTSALVEPALQRRQATAATRHPFVSYAVVGADKMCGSSSGAAEVALATAGPWEHMPAPTGVPGWVPCAGHTGLVTYTVDGTTKVAARALAWVDGSRPQRAVIVDLPLDAELVQQLRRETGVEIGRVVAAARGAEGDSDIPSFPSARASTGGSRSRTESMRDRVRETSERFAWPALVDHVDWDSGRTVTLLIEFRMALFEVYERISGTSASRFGDLSFGQVLLILLAVVGALFLIIQGVALLMGLGLARSITGAVHELFVGTERVRRGDFSHKIDVRSRDQLGELAASFNSMTASIEELLQQKAEKERLEQELRIARSIQMSLLPQGPMQVPGIGLVAHCEPAREVGGDYYDFLPIDEATLGILIADVSGKGTSAALYMAELKGIVLSLSERHTSPRELLIDANRIISKHLDSRSFITVTYVLIDLRARVLRYARAGHCPMIYVPGPYAVSRTPQILTPDGMVLGLTIDEGQMFTRFLDEMTLPLGTGDLFLLYTDGMSEAMNAAGDCFGDARLADVMAEHADLPSDQLLARILEQVGGFAGTAVQQDDMTMVLIRVEETGVVAVAGA
jgi:phosphoserine phosphatase RsbU/P